MGMGCLLVSAPPSQSMGGARTPGFFHLLGGVAGGGLKP